jgi:hypothetical protein
VADVKISQLTHIPSITDEDVMLISDIETLVSYKMDLSNLASYTSTALSSGSNLDTLFAGIKTVDGIGSGLDADLLDGQNGSYYLDWNNATNKPDPVLTLNGDVSGTATFTNLANATLTVTVSDDSHNHVIANVDGLQSALDSKLESSDFDAANVLTAIKTVDGSGSGLDADLLDGQNGSYYLDWNNATNKPDPVLTLDGDVSGTATFTNLANATLTVTVSDDSHNHVIANVDGLQSALDSKASLASPTFTGVPTAPTATAGTSNTQLATTAFVSTAVSNLVDTAPSTLDTLNELAAALGDNPNFATTVTNSLATKLPLAGGEMTGNITFSSTQTVDGRDLSVDGSKLDGIESGATADQTAAEILTAVKTVDGSGSGLDADLWDGNQFADYLDQSVKTTSNPTWPSATLTGVLTLGTSITHQGDADTSIGFTTNQIVLQAGGVDALTANSTQLLSPLPLTVGNGTDQDYDLIVTNSTKGAKLYWDESETKIATNWGFYVAGDVRFNSYATIKTSLGVGTAVNIPPTEALEVDGNISVTGTVDGRDIASDGSKLDGIESGATTDQTAAEILTAIKTVDGSGSGLDADLLDGIHASSFLRSDVSDQAAVIEFQGGVTYTPPAGSGSDTATDVGIALTSGNRLVGAYNGYIRSLLEWNSSNDIVIGQAGTALITGIDLLPGGSGDAKVNGNKIWHAGNDGSGSGLDADLLDGQQGSYYLDYNNFTNTPSPSGGGISYTRKTANYTASANEGIIADTTGGSFTITLPASPSVGDLVVVADGGNWNTNNLTIGRNGSTIEGDAENMTMDVGGLSVEFLYDGTTWQIYAQAGSSTSAVVGNWVITESSGDLLFSVSGVNKMKLTSTGDIVVTGDITTKGTI